MRVILYGSSLLMKGVETSLKALPGLELASLQTNSDKLREQVHRLQPDSVVVEAGTVPDELSMALLKEIPGLVLVTLDLECNRVRVLSGHQAQVVTTKDLVRAIEACRNATPPRPLAEAHLDRLSQFARAGLTAICVLPRRQKLAFAFATMAVCAVLGLLLLPGVPQPNAPRTGTAVGGPAPELAWAFAAGILLGGLLFALALGWGHHRSQSKIHYDKMEEQD